MPAVALSRVGARVVESGPDGEDLAAGTWQRLEALPVAPPPGGGAPGCRIWQTHACSRRPRRSPSAPDGWGVQPSARGHACGHACSVIGGKRPLLVGRPAMLQELVRVAAAGPEGRRSMA